MEGRMIRTNLFTLAVLVVLAATGLGTAAEAPKPEPVGPQQEKFYVYGGGCSRSIRLQGTYENVKDAFAAAETFRTKEKLSYVTVRTGAADRDHFGNGATEYKVYRLSGCRCPTWSLYAKAETADKAKEIAEKLKADSSPVEIVGYYAAK
jgi:hypothetical protein